MNVKTPNGGNSFRTAILVFVLGQVLASCAPEPGVSVPQVSALPTPAGPQARYPYLVTGTGRERVQMSWLEEGDDGVDLLWASWNGQAWTKPELIRQSGDFFVNWADFPSLVAGDEVPRAAHWLQKVPGSTYAYHVNLSLRSGQDDWSKPITPHADQSASEHGFASLLSVDDERIFAVWLDGHQTEHGEPMTLHSAIVDGDGAVSHEAELDSSVCDCCQTSIARSGNSVVAVYRDRSEGEIRDIYRSIYDLATNSWGEPMAVSNDGWEIHGCPVNGPQVAAWGETVIVTWFTGADDRPRSSVAVSHDGGKTFSDAIQVDSGRSDGRVGIAFSQAGEALLTWVEFGDETSRVMARTWRSNGLGEAFMVDEIESSRSSGFPRAAALKDGFVVAWTEPSSGAGISLRSVLPP